MKEAAVGSLFFYRPAFFFPIKARKKNLFPDRISEFLKERFSIPEIRENER